jgi:S1-C subfamily serine protease
VESTRHLKLYTLNGNGHTLEEHRFEVTAVKEASEWDLALLEPKVEAVLPEPAVVADHEVKPGDEVWAVGNPAGLSKTVAKGIVAHVERVDPRSPDGGIRWQLSIAGVAPGSSGGPIYDAEGQLIGIVQAGIPGTGIVFIAPLPILRDFLKD